MEPVSAVFGVMAALPQCIHSAKQLYDLRSRYKDASVLISAIYSESMVIAASLSQVQNLLQHDTLQSKPQLLETFDSALTGCRVVYGCLEEEVRDLVAKAEADDLKFKDRAKFLWREDTFKELLTQIRGQQSALSLLIQGLQMESIADIRKLVEENSLTLDQVVKRSKTLRQSHPRIRVPESLFVHTPENEDVADAESIVKSTEFAFDDEVINSKAYRRAMALYTSSSESKTFDKTVSKDEQDDPPAYETSRSTNYDQKVPSPVDSAQSKADDVGDEETKEATASFCHIQDATTNEHQDAFDAIEKDFLPYMPRITSTAPHLSSLQANITNQQMPVSTETQSKQPGRSHSDGDLLFAIEEVPPLPPRRPSGPNTVSAVFSSSRSDVCLASSTDSVDASSAPSVLSNISVASSRTTLEATDHRGVANRKPLRKPLPLRHQISHDILTTVRTTSSSLDSSTSAPPLQNAEMHIIWQSLIEAERNFIERMTKLRKMFHDNVLRQWPLLEKHIEAIPTGEKLANVSQELLLQIMEQQLSESEGALCDPAIFERWTNKIHTVYREFCQTMPHAVSSLRTTQNLDSKFRPFVNTVGLSLAWFGMGWEDYIKLPLTQLVLYADKLQSLIDMADALDDPLAFHEAARLKRALKSIQWLKTATSTTLKDAEEREEIQNLEKRIHTLDSSIFSQLRLLDATRRVKYQGSMAIKLKGQGSWQPVHVMLLDNYLLWGKVKPHKKSKGDRVIVLEAPIAVADLDVTTPCEEHQFQKATMFDDIPRGSVVYIINVRSISSDTMPHMLGAFGHQARQTWLEHLNAAASIREEKT